LRREDTWRIVAAAVALLVIVGFLLSTPSMIFARKIDVIDTELRDTGANPQRVLTKYDLANPKDLAKIPKQLGNWTLAKEYKWDSVATILDTNVLLSRDYARADVFQPVNLLIIQSGNVSSFHPAPVCYRAQGWDVPENEGDPVQVEVPNVTWAQQQWLSKDEQNVFSGNVSAKILTVTRHDANGTVTEKRMALYTYIKREDWRVTNSVTWVRVEMAVEPNATSAEVLPILSDLMRETVPSLFSFKVSEEKTLGETVVAKYGLVGGGGVALVLLSPMAVVVPALLRNRTGR